MRNGADWSRRQTTWQLSFRRLPPNDFILNQSTLTLTLELKGCKQALMLFSVPKDGNQGLENAIFRPWRTENKELR